MAAYNLTKDDFCYKQSGNTYKKQDADANVNSTFYAMTQGAKGIKAGGMDYEIEDDNGATVIGEIVEGNYYYVLNA